MKVSKSWLKELVDLKNSDEELTQLIPMRTIGIKEETDDFIELDMKGYNRADLLSTRGVAYEVAAITNSEVKFAEPAESDYLWLNQNLPQVNVAVEDSDLCPLYTVAKIEGLMVEPSNPEWVKKLTDSGIRPVNNVADITNLIMFEYGQPTHAFDARGVKDETIVVRRAKKGERITTLDGRTRNLETSDLLITDPQNALGVAGVMGGKDSEVSDSTNTILLEAAIFNPSSIRKTTQRLGLTSEASKRFQHGLTRKRLFQALDGAIRMYQALGGKLTALTIVGESEDQLKKVPLTLDKVNSLIGVEISEEQVEKYLKKLHFEISRHLRGGIEWLVTTPYFRLDIEIEEDLIEEIARMYGYEKIPAKKLSGELPEKLDQTLYNFLQDLKEALKNAGLTEVQTYSFYSSDVLENFEMNSDELIRIANPISSETQYLRNWITPNLLEVVAKNMRKGYKDIAIFEIGKVYLKKKSSLPDEKYYLAIALMNETDNPIQELYQISLGVKLVHPPGVQEKPGLPDKEEYRKLFHPTRFISFKLDEKDIGGIAELHPRIVNNFGIEKRVAILEIDLEPLSDKPV